jgi:carboxymethylenebutenolidase
MMSLFKRRGVEGSRGRGGEGAGVLDSALSAQRSAHGVRRRSGLASYFTVALIAAGAAALGYWFASHPSVIDHITTHGEWRWIPRGADSVRAYVAYPERSDRAPAIIVIHEIFGLTDWEPTVADKLAGRGYVAIVPDLLSRRFGMSPADPDSGRKLVAQLNPDSITADLNAAYDWLNQQPAVRPDNIATIGFCWGGGQSFRYATNNPKLQAVVVCYGPAPDSAGLSRIKAPVLGVYGEKDARINQDLPRVEDFMRNSGKRYVAEVYQGTGHGFLKPGRVGSDGPEVERAWTRILNFYRENLGH